MDKADLIPEWKVREACAKCTKNEKYARYFNNAPAGAKQYIALVFFETVFPNDLTEEVSEQCFKEMLNELNADDLLYLIAHETDPRTRDVFVERLAYLREATMLQRRHAEKPASPREQPSVVRSAGNVVAPGNPSADTRVAAQVDLPPDTRVADPVGQRFADERNTAVKFYVKRSSDLPFFQRLFSFAGRATRKDFWLTALGILAGLAILLVGESSCVKLIARTCVNKPHLVQPLALLLKFLFVALCMVLYWLGLANLVRRLHDLDLSGFWVVYLTPFGLCALLVTYMMGVDDSAKCMIERLKNVGSPWLGWILAVVAWTFGSVIGLFFALLMHGRMEDNMYGPNPYPVA